MAIQEELTARSSWDSHVGKGTTWLHNVQNKDSNIAIDNAVVESKIFRLMELPYEILLEIKPLISSEDLSAVSRSTRKLRDQLQPLLFEKFDVRLNLEGPGFTRFLRTILESPKLAHCVKHVSTVQWSAASIFNSDKFCYHKKPLARDARVLFSAINSTPMPKDIKRALLKGFKREVFVRDRDLKHKFEREHRVYAKPDIFLAILIANLLNLEHLDLQFFDCVKRDENRGINDRRANFPIWTWKIVELNASKDIQRGLRGLQNLKKVTINHNSGLLECPQGLPWLRLRSITTLHLLRIRLPNGSKICGCRSTVEDLSLSEVAISLEEIARLLKAPKRLLAVSYRHHF